ncbi:MAG: PDZ domain-containing protein [Flavobacteriaceae bacterium]|nr:PDZ domain-containing protein [Flavobacteriaceae bacterium]
MLIFSNQGKSQSHASFHTQRNYFKTGFTEVNNLIVIPAILNGDTHLNLILDTGSPYTLLIDFDYTNDISIKKGRQMTIGGLGQGFELQAYDSRFNHLKIAAATRDDTHLILILDSKLKLSKYLGMPVHGIIGFDIMKDFVVEIDYPAKQITFYQHNFFYEKKKRKISRFEKIPLEFHQRKPYIRGSIISENIQIDSARFLVDTGGWDAVWWFKNSKPNLQIPARHIADTLGISINGPVTGFRSKTDRFILHHFEFEKPTTSFPDSASLTNAVTFEGRNGSVGGEILRRFHVIFDYKNQNMFIRPNKNFKDDFYYNMSGIKLQKTYTLLPFLEIVYVRPGSPAYHAGIKPGDFVTSVNGNEIEEGELGWVNALFKSKPGKKITISLLRNGNKIVKSFILKDEL